MGKIITKTITRFDGGILDDVREPSDRGFQLSVHFDNTTNPLRLTPYRNSEANETKAQNIIRFLHTSGKMYGYGVVSGTSRPAIYFKANNNITDAWTAPTDNEASSGGVRNTNVFFHYKNHIYGFSGSTILWRWGDLTATPTFTETYQTLTTFTDVAEPVQHPTDDIAYFFTDNIVHKLNNTVWSEAVLTLPDNLIITDAEPWGNYLAIACKPKDDSQKSIVFLWDRDSSLSTISNKIDFGEGDLLYIAILDGKLIGVVDYFLNDNALNVDGGKLIIKVARSNKAETIKEMQKTADDTTNYVPNTGTFASERTKIVKDNKLHFPVAVSDQSDTFRGVGVVDSLGRITIDYIEEDASSIQGMFLLGNYWFIAHSADGSVNRTDNDANFTYTSIYQSQKFTLGDASITKKLLGVTVMTAPQPTAGQIVFRYRKDEETAWTTIFTDTEDNSISHSAINIESTGATLPEYKEIQLRIESTGATEITGFKFKSEVIDKDLY